MSRSPFQVPSGCPQIVVDTNFLGSLPFCSVPSFSDPTFAPRLVPVLPPDIAPPENCICLSFHVTAAERIMDIPSPMLSMRVAKVGEDCCDGVQQVSLFMDVPCMPVYVKAKGQISLLADMSIHAATAMISLKKGKSPSCGLSLAVNIDIPCVPFDIEVSGKLSVKDAAAAVKYTFTTPPHECKMVGALDLDIPCVPFNLGAGATISGDFDIVTDPAETPSIGLAIALTKNGCVLGVGGSLQGKLARAYCVVGDADAPDTLFKSIEVF